MHWESENVSIFTKLILLLYPNKSLIKWLCYSILFNSQNNNFASMMHKAVIELLREQKDTGWGLLATQDYKPLTLVF